MRYWAGATTSPGHTKADHSRTLDGPGPKPHGYYPPFHILLMGVSGAFLTGDLFNLYVWFEFMLPASC